MIVKIVDKENKHDSLYECESVIMNSTDKPYVSIDIQQSTKCISIDINRANEVIYLMNNNGKTIETYRWDN